MKKRIITSLTIIILVVICVGIRLFTPLFGPPVYVYMVSSPLGPSQYETLPNGRNIYKADELISVTINNDKDAELIKYFKNIKWIECTYKVDDLSFISDINVELLYLPYPCEDYSYLENVSSINTLILSKCSLEKADELPVMENLESLEISTTESFSCEGIDKFANLKYLYIRSDSKIRGFNSLGEIPALEEIVLLSKDYDISELSQIRQVDRLVLNWINDEEKRQEIVDAFAGSDVNVVFD